MCIRDSCYWVTDGENGIAQGKGAQQSSASGEGTKYSATGMTAAQMAEESFVQTLNNGREAAATAAGVDLFQISPWSFGDGSPVLTPEQDVPAITVVGLLETLNVDNGTEFSALPLPTTVQVSLSNNKTMDVPVTWAEGNYDSATQGSYTLTGTIEAVSYTHLDVYKRQTVDCSYNSAYGTIVSNWSYENGNFLYDATVPANTTCLLYTSRCV